MTFDSIFLNIILATLVVGSIMMFSYYYLPKSKKIQKFIIVNQKYLHPNVISTLRAIAGPIIAYYLLIYSGNFKHYESTVLIQIIAFLAATDALDGQIARCCNLVTKKGKSLDALCDKLFDIPILLVLSYQINEYIFLGIIILTIFEIIGQSLRTKLKDAAAATIGKIKTTVKFIAIFLFFLYIVKAEVVRFEYILEFLVVITIVCLVFTAASMGLKIKNLLAWEITLFILWNINNLLYCSEQRT